MIFKDMEFYNIHELKQVKGIEGWRLLRIPEALRMKLSDLGQSFSLYPNGSEIRFNMLGDAAKITLLWDKDKSPVDCGILEVYFGPFQGGAPKFLRSGEKFDIIITRPKELDLYAGYARQAGLGFDANLVRLILPYEGILHFVEAEGAVSPPAPGQTPEKRYLAYGSSITHGSAAVSTTGAYAMRTAQYLNADLLSLGFAGSARLEPEMADYILSRDDWDFATLEMGINMISSFSEEEFEARVNRFVSMVAKKHSDKWIFCIDMFPYEADYRGDAKATRFREIVAQTVEGLGLARLRHIPGNSILKSLAGLTIDMLHPSSFGMEEMAQNLSNEIKKSI